MAIKIYEQFAPFANPADGDYPYGSIKNDSIPGAEDGTPLDATWANDYAGTDAELFAQAEIVPNGQPDKLGASQRVDAMRKIFSNVGTVADVASGKFKVGNFVCVTDRSSGIFQIVSGGTPDGYGVINAGEGKTAVTTDKTGNVAVFGAVDGVDSSQAVMSALAKTNKITSPRGFNLVCKNISLSDNSNVNIDSATLPPSCNDGDLLFEANGKSNVSFIANLLDGNKTAQSGTIKTKLLEFTLCTDANVYIRTAKGNYCLRTSSPSTDAGAITFNECTRGSCVVDFLTDWAREGVWVRECIGTTAQLKYGLGTDQEYSGIQVGGVGCTLLDSKVENAGASSIGFDTRNGVAGNLISINPRFFNGVNFGHSGAPSTGSTVSSVVSIGAAQDGISHVASGGGLVIGCVYISSSGRHGINQSDGASGLVINGGVSKDSASSNCNIFSGTATLSNLDLSVGGASNIVRGVGTTVLRSNVRLSVDSMTIFAQALNGSSDVTVTNGNIQNDSLPVLSASNLSAATAIPYIKTVNNGSLVIGVVNAAAGGANVRIDIN